MNNENCPITWEIPRFRDCFLGMGNKGQILFYISRQLEHLHMASPGCLGSFTTWPCGSKGKHAEKERTK